MMSATDMDRDSSLFAHVLYLLSLVAVALLLPIETLSRFSSGILLFLGVIGVWRYGWGLLHFVRAWLYRRWIFPRMRARVAQINADTQLPTAYLLVTSFRIDRGVTESDA